MSDPSTPRYFPEQVRIVLIDPTGKGEARLVGPAAGDVLGKSLDEQHLLRPVARTGEEIGAAITFVRDLLKQRLHAGRGEDHQPVVLMIDELLNGRYTPDDLLQMLLELANQGVKYHIEVIISEAPDLKTSTDTLLKRSLAARYVGRLDGTITVIS